MALRKSAAFSRVKSASRNSLSYKDFSWIPEQGDLLLVLLPGLETHMSRQDSLIQLGNCQLTGILVGCMKNIRISQRFFLGMQYSLNIVITSLKFSTFLPADGLKILKFSTASSPSKLRKTAILTPSVFFFFFTLFKSYQVVLEFLFPFSP